MTMVESRRDPNEVLRIAEELGAITTRSWTLMELCGGQTHSLMRWGLLGLLPPTLSLVHGPGCPVCVTSTGAIDAAIRLGLERQAIICSYGDMLRVPGSMASLAMARSQGADVRIVTSPLQVLKIAADHNHRQVVFFAIGFETTCPGSAALISQLKRHGIENVSIIMSHVRVYPVMEAILSQDDSAIDGFIAAGHVAAVTGYQEYGLLAQRFHVPIVVTGFEPLDLMRGIYSCVAMLERHEAFAVNAYNHVVREEGNPRALLLMHEYLEPCDREWRGLGVICRGGFRIKPSYRELDAYFRFGLESPDQEPDIHRHQDSSQQLPRDDQHHMVCMAGEVLLGRMSPLACPLFDSACRPERPQGAPMVSSEGACAAYYAHKGRK